MNIKKKANSLAKKYGSRNPFEIIDHLNVIVVFHPLEGVRGFYQYFQRNNIIYIDERLSYKEKMFVCAHELGHMLLHKKANALFMDSRTYFVSSKYENEANVFAAELLIPDSFVIENQDLTKSQLARLAGYEEKIMDYKKDIFASVII